MRDYLVVSKPRIVLVLVITAVTSMLAATRFDNTPAHAWDVNPVQLGFLILTGAMASMGSSALNHYYDRDIDAVMDRTSNRPIPAKRLPPRNVFVYGILLCAISIVVAWFTLNPIATSMIGVGIFFYVIVYTRWLKRVNPSNIVIGGFAGSAASMAGWATTTGSIDLLGFMIGWIVFLWTPPHFWCLAIRARQEYASVNVPMLPVLIGNERTATYIFASTAILVPYCIVLYVFGLGVLYTVVAAVSGALMLIYQYNLVRNPTPEFAWKAYKVTAPFLVIVFTAIALDALFYIRF